VSVGNNEEGGSGPNGTQSLRVTGRVPQRLKPGVENQSEWLASYAEVFALPKIDFDLILG
jgi:hypothetical protein